MFNLEDHPSVSGRDRVLLAFCLLFYLVLAAANCYTKAPWDDEGMFANPAIDLITRGSMGVSVMEPRGSVVKPGVEYVGVNHYFYGQPFFDVVSAGWYKVFGVSVFAMRSESMLWGVAFLLAWFVILLRLSGRSTLAVLGVFLIGINHVLVDAASDGRPDMACAALGTVAIAVYLSWRQRNLRYAVFFSHALLGMSAATHPNAMIYLFGVVLFTLYLDWRRLRISHLLCAGAGYLVVFIPWGLYLARDFATASKQLSLGANNRFSTAFTPWSAIKAEIWDRYGQQVYFPPYSTGVARVRVLVPLFYVLGVAGALFTGRIRRHPGYRLLLILTALVFVTMSILVGQKTYYYLVHATPLYAALLAVWLYETADAMPRIVPAGLVFLYALFQVGWLGYDIRRDAYHREYLPVAEYVKQHSAGQLVMGPVQLGFVLGFFDNLMDDGSLGYYNGKHPDWIVMDDRGYHQAYLAFPKTAPQLYAYESKMLATEFVLVRQNRLYEVYERKK